MSVIGIELDADQLVLTKRRDFKWTFQNLDDSVPPAETDFPAGDLYFELDVAEGNAIQQVELVGGTGGTYTFDFKGDTTDPITFYEVTTSPHRINADITSALEALDSVGVGNVYVHPAQLFPVWKAALNIGAPINEVQRVTVRGNPTSGFWRLSCGFDLTSNIDWNASAAQVQTKLEALTSIGSGNVTVTKPSDWVYQVEFVGAKAGTDMPQLIGYSLGWEFALVGGLFPTVGTDTLVNGIAPWGDTLTNLMNKTINDFFNSFDHAIGVDIDFTIEDDLNMTLTITSLTPFQEVDAGTLALDITDNTIKAVLNAASNLFGILDIISFDTWWNHLYQVEFVGDLAETWQPMLTADLSDLEGDSKQMTITQINAGRYLQWHFDISGAEANLKVESEDVDQIQNRTLWQLVFLPAGEPAGGDPVARGTVKVQS